MLFPVVSDIFGVIWFALIHDLNYWPLGWVQARSIGVRLDHHFHGKPSIDALVIHAFLL